MATISEHTNTSTFAADLEQSKPAVKELISLLESRGIVAYQAPDEYFPDYDVIDDRGMTYEVKTDRLWKKTHNIAVEPQTLQHTKARYYVYKLKGVKGLFLLPTYTVEQLYRMYPKKIGGDQGLPQALVPVREFINNCVQL